MLTKGQLEAQQGPSGVGASSAEISRTDTVGQEESLKRVDWAGLAVDFQLFGDF